MVSSQGAVPIVTVFGHRAGGLERLARSVLEGFVGRKGILFANSRSDVEELTSHLKRVANGQGVDVFPHHGSLSARVRHEAETALRDSPARTLVVATSSLELGIDIGEVDAVVQVGVPSSPSTLTQRLGRSGRRGAPSQLHLHVHRSVSRGAPTALHEGLVQAVATTGLVLRGELDAVDEPMHGSTFVHQLLSATAAQPGLGEREALEVLSPAFPLIGPGDAAAILEALRQHGLLCRDGGRLVLTESGAARVGSFTFYAAFRGTSEYRVVWTGGTIGKVTGWPPETGERFVLGGRPWVTLSVHNGRRLIEVSPDTSGDPARFLGSGIPVGDEVRREMLGVYNRDHVPGWLDPVGRSQLEEARETFARLGLGRRDAVEDGRDVFLFPWRGDRVVRTMQRALEVHGLRAKVAGMCVLVRSERLPRVAMVLGRLDEAGLPAVGELVPPGASREKFDRHLPPAVLARDRAGRLLDIPGASEAIGKIDGSLGVSAVRR